MSLENDRNRKGAGRSCLSVSPEAASDHSTMQNVFGFLQDYVPQAVSGPKEERRRERVQWARFEVGDLNDLSLPHLAEAHRENRQGPLPLLLVLGFNNGYSVWTVMPGGDAKEVYFCFGEGETARVVRLLRSPEKKEGATKDAYADKRPIVAVVKKGRHSSSGSCVAYSTLQLLSLRSKETSEGGNVLKKVVFKTRPIVDVHCNRRVVAIVFQKRIVVLCAASLENKFVIKNNYPSSGFPCNPVALGTKWLAFSETKLSSKQQSIGGMSHTTTSSVATTMLKNVRKGITALTETISGLKAKAQGDPSEKPHQDAPVAFANIVTVVDISLNSPEQEMRLQDLGREGALVAHFVAHAGPDVHIAALAFNPSGNLLVSASTEGHTFHVFQLLPHPFLSSETAVHHLYTLYRGATSGVVQDLSFSSDSRWVAVSTLNGTTHVFPISSYGGEPTVRTHTSSRVVNKMSRFHTSAGMDLISHHQELAAKNMVVPKSTQPHVTTATQTSQAPPTVTGSICRDHTHFSSSNSAPTTSVSSHMNGYSGWNNPRSLPLPTPISITALQQIKQPYQPSSVVGVANSKGSREVAMGSREGGSLGGGVGGGGRGDGGVGSGEPHVTLAGPDAVCVRAVFGDPSDALLGGLREDSASYSLYVFGGNGSLVEHHLYPQKLSAAPDGEDAPIKLAHYSKLCWRLMGDPPVAMAPGSLPLPLKEDNPLLMANDMHRKFSSQCHVGICSPSPHLNGDFTPAGPAPSPSQLSASDDQWLSQVEIQTHAPPSRRLWMGPQFTFKPYPPSTSSPTVSGSVSSAELIKTPSPPNTIIYSSSLNSSISSNILSLSHQESGRSGEQNVLLFPSVESPLLDALSESPSSGSQGSMSGPLAVPGGMRIKRIAPTEDEVFGSWGKVAPLYNEESEVERQLKDAMGEQEASVIVTQDLTVKTGFSPPGP